MNAATMIVSRSWPDRRQVAERRVDVDLSYNGVERRQPTAAQIAESERRAEGRFAAEPIRHTAHGGLDRFGPL